MRRTGKPPESGPIIIVQQIQKHEWIMRLPRITEEVADRLGEGTDLLGPDPKRATSVFLELLDDYPEYLDAYHHLALTLEKMGRKERAFQTRKLPIAAVLKFFPEHFSMEHDQLDWGFVENRPFLRLYHSYGLQLLEQGQTEDALDVFENLLRLSPNDNLGARALVVGCLLELKEPSGVLSVCRQFPDDAMEYLIYGKALALFQLGKVKQAEKALDFAVKCYPLIGDELLKTNHRKPKGMDDQRVTLGGPDQAHMYWQDHGRYWKESPGAIDLLRQRTKGRIRRRTG